MKKVYFNSFMFFILFAFSSLNSFSSPFIFPTQNSFRCEVDHIDSINMDLIGMWNYGYPLAIYTRGNYLYLGSGGCAIIYDVSDTTNPEKK